MLPLARCYQGDSAHHTHQASEGRTNHVARRHISTLTLGGAVQASYSLVAIKQLVSGGRYLITVTALETAALMGFDDESIVEMRCRTISRDTFLQDDAGIVSSGSNAGCLQDFF